MESKKTSLFFYPSGRIKDTFIPSFWEGIFTDAGDKYSFSFQLEEEGKTFLVLGTCEYGNFSKAKLACRIPKRKLLELFCDKLGFLAYCEGLWISSF